MKGYSLKSMALAAISLAMGATAMASPVGGTAMDPRLAEAMYAGRYYNLPRHRSGGGLAHKRWKRTRAAGLR